MNDQPNSNVTTTWMARYMGNPTSQYTTSFEKVGLKKTADRTKKDSVGNEFEILRRST
jgi:hypothetical protein